jgi:hypothetical protein
LKIGKGEENDKMDKTEAGAVIKCLQKKGKTPKEIHKTWSKHLMLTPLRILQKRNGLLISSGERRALKMTHRQVTPKLHPLMIKWRPFSTQSWMADVYLLGR